MGRGWSAWPRGPAPGGRPRRAINAIFDEHDVVLTPVAAQPLPVGRLDGQGPLRAFHGGGHFAGYTAVWNVTGHPAAACPPAPTPTACRSPSSSSAPRRGSEATLLALSAQLEEARPWAHRRALS